MRTLRAMSLMLMRFYLPLLVFALSAAAAALYLDARQQQLRLQEARTVSRALDAGRAEFLKNLNSVMYLATGVVAYIQANHGFVATAQTESWLRSLPDYNAYIRNIGLAPGNRISQVYPREGNERALGLYYPDLPEQWPRVALAIERRRPVVDGPIALVQGGTGLIHRAPVFLADGSYWGMVSTVMRLDTIMAELQAQTAREGVELRFLHDRGEPSEAGPGWYAVDLRVEDLHWRLAGRKLSRASTAFDPHAFWAWSLVLLLTLGAGKLSAMSWRQRDLQISLNESLTLFQVAFQQVPHGLLVLDKAQRIVEANPVMRGMLGQPLAALRGKALPEVVAEAQRAALIRLLADTSGTASHTLESELHGLDGDGGVPVELGIVRLQHERLGFLVFIRDIRDSLRLQRIQNEFISTASHELRTPLTSIIGALELLRSGSFGVMPAEALPLLDMASGNSERLHRLINDLLDANRLLQGKLRLVIRPVAALEVARAVLSSLTPIAIQSNVRLTLEAPEAAWILADADKLAQILVNLVANAIRFSHPQGEVILRMRRTQADVHFSVQDFGPGIDPAFASRAFTRFGQADSSDTRSQSGTGLGLFICKGLVERMQGRIGYESRLGEGATFWFELPAVETPPAG